MVNTIAQILNLKTEASLRDAFQLMEAELIAEIAPLEQALETTVQSMDPATNFRHAAFVGSWRNKIARCLMLVTGFVEHAKSDSFLLPKAAGVTEVARDMHRRGLAGPFVAWQRRLEHLIEDIDCRVNFCKKCIESEKNGRSSGAFSTEY